MGETPSRNCMASARGLAQLAAFMAGKGTFQGKQLLSEETWNEFHANPKFDWLDGLFPSIISKGGCNHYGLTPSLK